MHFLVFISSSFPGRRNKLIEQHCSDFNRRDSEGGTSPDAVNVLSCVWLPRPPCTACDLCLASSA
jgi:hypothetical protein